ncbi:hypothetical protein [Streptococcus pantholopis]|uniref:hypothetical protein n=1 Tax=Streptococcus pantholopis TaxID=1811193 RepID=UPI00082F1792|nr:hypothetical protein [Streptococcus pantholopis]
MKYMTFNFLRHKETYQIVYTVAFMFSIYAYFIKRYLVDADYIIVTVMALLLNVAVFVWHTYLCGWSRQSVLALISAGLFALLMPHQAYLQTFVSDFSVLSFFLLSVSVDPKQEDFVSFVLYAKLFLALAVFLLYINGKIPDVTLFRPAKELVRHSYGFGHPNSLSMFMTSIFLDLSLIRKKPFRFLETLIFALAVMMLYAVTDSRTGFIAGLLILFCTVLYHPLNDYEILGRDLFIAILTIFLLGLLLSAVYSPNSAVLTFFNRIFSSRLSNAHTYLEEYGLSLFPRSIDSLHYANGATIFNENFYVDSLLRQGLLLYCLFPALIALQTLGRRFKLYHAILILSAFLTAMIEDYGVSCLIFTCLLFNYFAIEENRGLSWREKKYPEVNLKNLLSRMQ